MGGRNIRSGLRGSGVGWCNAGCRYSDVGVLGIAQEACARAGGGGVP